LVVWKHFLERLYPNDIYGTRVAPDGEILDSSGIPIRSTEEEGEEFPSVSWDGTNFFVTWRRYPGTSILGARVTPQGEVLDPEGTNLGLGGGYNQRLSASASDGISSLAVWEHQLDADNWDIAGIRVDSAGTILGNRLKVSIGSNSQTNGTAGWDGENFLVVWQDLRFGQYSDLYGTRINPSEGTLDTAAFPICRLSQREYNPKLAWNGENFLVVWQDRRDGDFNIYGTLVSPEGVVPDSDGFGIAATTCQPGSWCEEEYPALDWSGESFMVVWRFERGWITAIKGRRISAGGDLIGSSLEIPTTEYFGAPNIAWGDTNYLVVFRGKGDIGSYDIYGQLISIDGTLIGNNIPIYQDDFTQGNPYIAWGAGNYLVVWEDDRNGDYDIYGARVSSQGDILDPEGIPIFVGTGIQEPCGLTYDGTNYVVLWLDEGADEYDNLNATYCTRVSPEGVVLDLQGTPIFSNTLSLSSLHISPGDSNLSFIVGSKLVEDPPFSSPRLCGAFFWGDSIPNYPPEPFSLLSPADGDTVVRPACLDWEEAQDPNQENDVNYDLYFSTSAYFDPDSTITIESIFTSEYVLDDLEYSIPYYWKVRAYDQWSSTWSDQIWSFDVENYGDASGDGIVDVADIIYLVNYLFAEGSAPDPLASGDENGDCLVDVADVVYLVNYLFLGGSPPQQGCA
jgi:hypothetical protein